MTRSVFNLAKYGNQRESSKNLTRSYPVQTSDGAIYRRNRKHLMKAKGDPVKVHDFHPIVLAQPESPISNEQAPLPPPSNINNNSSEGNLPYITRSGRQVKPNQRYSTDDGLKSK